jgi:hypothetical protein
MQYQQRKYIIVLLYAIFKYFDFIWFWLCLTPLSATFQLYHGDQFSGGRSRSIRREPPTMGKYHLRLRVECTLFCNLQSRARTHAVLVICLYELLGYSTTWLIESPGPLNILYMIYSRMCCIQSIWFKCCGSKVDLKLH